MKQIIILCLFACLLATSCCDMTHDEDLFPTNNLAKTRMMSPHVASFSVNETLVRKYLDITSNNKTILSINPIVQNTNDTLAYIVQFSQGWDLISGDTRISPSLACSETGTFDIDEYHEDGIGGIDGLLDIVAQTKQSTDTNINTLWNFLLQKHETGRDDNGIAPCGDVAGMWIPIDTQYVDNGVIVHHIIPTQWHQDTPYNDACQALYTGTYGNVKSLAGCGPIACGQVIYKYLKNNNPFSVEIPTAISYYNSGHITFSDLSATQWANLTTSDGSLSKYIIYLGQNIMNAKYTPYITIENGSFKLNRGVSVYSKDCQAALDWAHLQYTQDSIYNWQNIVSSLQLYRPIIVTAFDSSHENGHAFIIDALKKTDLRAYITYEWRNDYHPDYWELQTYPAWMFDTSVMPTFSGDGELYQEELVLDDNIKIAMNWGYGSSSADNVYYLLRNGNTTLYPSWTVNGITYNTIDRLFYNIRQ